MDSPKNSNRNRPLNNGFFVEQGNNRHSQRPATPGNFSLLTTVSEQVAARNANQISSNNVNTNGSAIIKYPNYHANLVGVQSKFRRKYYHKALLSSLVLLIVIFFITIIVIIVTRVSPSAICDSKECLRTAASLIYSMDQKTDPCEDFYQFTCGHWGEEHPRPDSTTSNDWFRERQAKVMRHLREYLQSNISSDDPSAVSKVKMMYKSCMDTNLLDKRKLEPLVNFLKIFELPLLPRGLNITLTGEHATKNESAVSFDWLRTIVLIKRNLGMDVIIGFDIFPDPFNRTVNRIALGTPETDSSLPFNKDDIHQLMRKIRRKMMILNDENDDADDDDKLERDEEESAKRTSEGMAAYLAYVKKILQIYIQYLDPDAKIETIEDNLGEMTTQAVEVAKKFIKFKDDAENTTKSAKNPIEDLLYLSITELQNHTDKLIAPKTLPIWKQYLNTLMDGVNHTKKFTTDGIKIITSHADVTYLQAVSEYLLEVPSVNLEFYIWLSAVEELILHTTAELRLLHTEYMRTLTGTEGSTPRSLYCAHGVNSLMGMAVSYALGSEEFSKQKLPRVQRMLDDIRHSFDNLVRAVTWMDKPTKQATLEKSASMRSFIGFPDWIRNRTSLDEYYAPVEVNVSTHLENMVGVLRWQMNTKLSNLYHTEAFGWATSPSNVNAFHTFQSNAITIPIAILQYPFYDLGLEALNYGSIGTILGHELTHGFDDSGRMFDKNGNMLQWWSNETINEYINRTECFVDQYNHFYLPDIGEYIDGELTLGENIADNGGMREAFYAYRLYTKTSGKEKLKLPGLEHFTHEQLFFISFGNLWCETLTPAASRFALEDSHCPGRIRLKGVLSNSDEFAEAFKCRKGSGMNPKEPKCKIW